MSDAKKVGEFVGVIICVIAAIIFVIWLIFFAYDKLAPKAMSNDEIIKQTKQCKDADMYPSQRQDFAFNTVKIVCENKRDDK